MYEVKKFTRDNPCTKVDIWNAFAGIKGFVKTPVVKAKAVIGEHTPKYLLTKGYIDEQEADGVLYYALTDEGKEWLLTGLYRRLVVHPRERSRMKNVKVYEAKIKKLFD